MKSPAKTTSVHREAISAMVVRALGIGLTFISTTTLARIMGPDSYGAYSTALATATLMAALAPLGTDRTLVRTLSSSIESRNCGNQVAVVHAATGLIALSFLACSVATYFVGAFALEGEGTALTALQTAILVVPLTLVYLRQWMAIPLIGTRRAVAMEQIALPSATVIITLAAYMLNVRFQATHMSIVTAILLTILWAVSTQQAKMKPLYVAGIHSLRSVRLDELKRSLTEGLPFVSVAIGSVLTQSCIPVVIALSAGFSAAAFFALAAPYAALAAIPLGMFALSMFTTCTQHYERREWQEANHSVRSAATATFGLSVFIAGAVWLAAPAITVFLGHNYEPVRRILPILLLSTIIDALTGPTIPVMQTMHLERLHARLMLFFVPIQFAMIWSLTTLIDVEGAAIGYFASRCLWNVAIVNSIYRQRGLLMLPYLSVLNARRTPPPANCPWPDHLLPPKSTYQTRAA